MRTITALLSILFSVSLGAMAPAPVKAERVFREAWGCVIEVGGPYASTERSCV